MQLVTRLIPLAYFGMIPVDNVDDAVIRLNISTNHIGVVDFNTEAAVYSNVLPLHCLSRFIFITSSAITCPAQHDRSVSP